MISLIEWSTDPKYFHWNWHISVWEVMACWIPPIQQIIQVIPIFCVVLYSIWPYLDWCFDITVLQCGDHSIFFSENVFKVNKTNKIDIFYNEVTSLGVSGLLRSVTRSWSSWRLDCIAWIFFSNFLIFSSLLHELWIFILDWLSFSTTKPLRTHLGLEVQVRPMRPTVGIKSFSYMFQNFAWCKDQIQKL